MNIIRQPLGFRPVTTTLEEVFAIKQALAAHLSEESKSGYYPPHVIVSALYNELQGVKN